MHQKVLRMNLNSPKIGLKELEVVFFWPETTQFLVKNGGGIGGTPSWLPYSTDSCDLDLLIE